MLELVDAGADDDPRGGVAGNPGDVMLSCGELAMLARSTICGGEAGGVSAKTSVDRS